MGVYEALGVRPVINATCHWTVYGGSVMWPEVTEAMVDARCCCVDMRQLLDRASEVITSFTHAEAAHVVSGAAAGLQVGAAAIMTGADPVKMQSLPRTDGLKTQFIAHRFPRRRTADGHEYTHWGYGHAVRGAGGEFVEIGDEDGITRDQFEAAIAPETAGVYWLSEGTAGISLEDVVTIARRHELPVLIDASNTLPPVEHLHSFIDRGADLVAFSGGKGLRGPQGSGILTGRGDLIRAARLQSAPIQGIGRPMKVSKEEIIGLLTALEVYARRNHAADLQDSQRRTAFVVASLSGLRGIHVEHRFPDHIGRPYPTAFVHLDPNKGMTGADVIAALLAGTPSVAVMDFGDPFTIRVDVRVLSDADTEQVVSRLCQVLTHRESA
jgi:L-seryl-tRNA(Ser) seleniumtransferase